MIRLLTFLLSILLALASMGGYLVLNAKINAGERLVSMGKDYIADQSPVLVEGKADLATGKQQLSAGKKEYEHAHDNSLLVFADKLFNGGKGFAEGRKKIADGEAKVAQGEDKIDVGEKRLAKGNMELQQGVEELQQGKVVRDICAYAAVIFTLLSIMLGYFWRRSLIQFLRHLHVK